MEKSEPQKSPRPNMPQKIEAPSGLGSKSRLRAREHGIMIGLLQPGPQNSITDVPGVRVGHSTLNQGDKIRTGITCILPHAGNLFKEKVIFVRFCFEMIKQSTRFQELYLSETDLAKLRYPSYCGSVRSLMSVDRRARPK